MYRDDVDCSKEKEMDAKKDEYRISSSSPFHESD